jgi:hypothetical protein
MPQLATPSLTRMSRRHNDRRDLFGPITGLRPSWLWVDCVEKVYLPVLRNFSASQALSFEEDAGDLMARDWVKPSKPFVDLPPQTP